MSPSIGLSRALSSDVEASTAIVRGLILIVATISAWASSWHVAKTLVLQVKVGNKKCFFPCIYTNLSHDSYLWGIVDEFGDNLHNTLENIKGKIPYINIISLLLT